MDNSIKRQIGIVGCGNMGEAILSQTLRNKAKKAKLSSKNFIVYEKDNLKQAFIKRIYRVKAAKGIADLVNQSDIVIIAVKPQDIDIVLDEMRKAIQRYKKRNILLISIAAGIKTEYIENKMPGKIKVLRAMPNMPAAIGEGITALTKGRFARDTDLRAAKALFGVLGEVVYIRREALINVVTALSGSGPAYWFYILNAMLATAKSLHLDKKTANELVCHTIIGSLHLLSSKKFDAETLISKVASKGGTTEAALKVFRERDLDKIIQEAIIAAYKRALELSR